MRDVINAFKEMLVRFFESRFTSYDERQEYVTNLMMLLEKERLEKLELLRMLGPQEYKEEGPDLKDLKPIMPRVIPWHVKKQRLEQEAWEKAQALKKQPEVKNESVEELENLLDINNGTENAGQNSASS